MIQSLGVAGAFGAVKSTALPFDRLANLKLQDFGEIIFA